jgi:hypothetical protein
MPEEAYTRAGFFLLTVRNRGGAAFVHHPDKSTDGPAKTTAVPGNPRNAL